MLSLPRGKVLMLSVSSLLIAVFLSLISFYWHFRMRSKEIALSHAKKICETHQLQLLDQSISFSKITFEKRFNKRCLIKVFEFDYTDKTQNRKTACLILHGSHLLNIHMNHVNIFEGRHEKHNISRPDKKKRDNIIEFPRK